MQAHHTEYTMNKLLALAGVVALMTACAGMSNGADGESSGATVAAILGYHGPVHRTGAFGE